MVEINKSKTRTAAGDFQGDDNAFAAGLQISSALRFWMAR